MTYLITFSCYGARLHGDERGTVDRHHNIPGNRALSANAQRASAERRQMDQEPYLLDQDRRTTVLEAILEVASHRGWELLAAHVRTTHVHTVVQADVSPERAMNDFKAYASRRLALLGHDPSGRKRWARHGSTRWLWKYQNVLDALQYVVAEQGEPMALFVAELE
jgi:REP element-mobilizing transposase RayT